MPSRSGRLTLLMLLAFLPFERIPSFELAGITWRLPLFFGLALITLVRPKINLRSFYTKALLTFLGIYLLSAIVSPFPGRALAAWGFTLFVALLAFSVAEVSKKMPTNRVLGTLVIGGTLIGIFAIFQFFADLGGVPTPLSGLREMYTSGVFGFPRAQATALEPLYFANYLLIPLSLLSIGAVSVGVSFWLLSINYLAFLLTLSRGGIVAAAIVTLGALSFSWSSRNWKSAFKIVASIAAASGAALVIFNFIVPQLSSFKSPDPEKVYANQLTNYEIGNPGAQRAKAREQATEVFLQNPVLGSGPGTFGAYMHRRDPKNPPSQIVNNEPLELLAEGGLLSFLTFVIFALSILFAGFRKLKKLNPIDKGMLLALLTFLIATSVQYLSFSTLYIIHIWVVIGLVMGFIDRAAVKPATRA